jgi:uracil-DNA glycosylase
MTLVKSWIDFLELDAVFFTELRNFLLQFDEIIPSENQIFAAFNRVDPSKVKAIILGEDPYPRKTSACGIAFLDAEIKSWDSKTRGNSLKHIHKALLIQRGLADYSTPLAACREASKKVRFLSPLELFELWMKQGVLLLNTALTFSSAKDKAAHFAFWQPFMRKVLSTLESKNQPHYILWGKKAQAWADCFEIANRERIIAQGHPTYQHHFLSKTDAQYSPFKEIEERTAIKFS